MQKSCQIKQTKKKNKTKNARYNKTWKKIRLYRQNNIPKIENGENKTKQEKNEKARIDYKQVLKRLELY